MEERKAAMNHDARTKLFLNALRLLLAVAIALPQGTANRLPSRW